MADHAFITGDVRPGVEFRFTSKPGNAAASTFTVIIEGKMIVTRYAANLFRFPDATPVLAHWHGEWRTDGFATTVGELKAKAKVLEEQDSEAKARAKAFKESLAREKEAAEVREFTRLKAKLEGRTPPKRVRLSKP